MNIDRTSAARPLHTPTPIVPTNTDSAAAAPAPSADDATRRDRIDLSRAARDLSQQPEDAREARVRELRAQVDAGTYHVDADSVAEQVIKSGDL